MSERKPAPNVDGMFTLKVDNIAFESTTESIKEHFAKHGEIGDVYIPRNFGSNDPRGFAFVRFIDKRDAEDAQRALDNTEMDGRIIKIQEARERRAENPRDAMSSRGGGYRGRDFDDRRGGRRDDDRRDRRRSRSRSRSYDRDRGSRRSDDRHRRSRSRSNDRSDRHRDRRSYDRSSR